MAHGKHRVASSKEWGKYPGFGFPRLLGFPTATYHEYDAKAVRFGRLKNIHRKFAVMPRPVNDAVDAIVGRMVIPPAISNQRGDEEQ